MEKEEPEETQKQESQNKPPQEEEIKTDFTWFKNARIYQIFIDRFAGYKTNYSEEELKTQFLYGNLKALLGKLDYIASMDFNVIWLSPFFANQPKGYHGYHPINFNHVDPRFAFGEHAEDNITGNFYPHQLNSDFSLIKDNTNFLSSNNNLSHTNFLGSNTFPAYLGKSNTNYLGSNTFPASLGKSNTNYLGSNTFPTSLGKSNTNNLGSNNFGSSLGRSYTNNLSSNNFSSSLGSSFTNNLSSNNFSSSLGRSNTNFLSSNNFSSSNFMKFNNCL